MTIDVPMTKDRSGRADLITIILKEQVRASYNLGSTGEYVNVSEIEGRLLIEPDFNRGEMIDIIERINNISIFDKFRRFLNDENEPDNDGILILNYGTLVFSGSEPVNIENTLDLKYEYTNSDIRKQSPDKLKNDMKEEITYELTYDDLEGEFLRYLNEQGISRDQVEMGVPLHLQAKAEPIAESKAGTKETGTQVDIVLKNKSLEEEIRPSTIQVDMPPRIGRGVKIHDSGDITNGDYNPKNESYEFNIQSIPPNSKSIASLRITSEAKGQLEEINGKVVFKKDTPFSDMDLQGFYDSGGREAESGLVELRQSGAFTTTFTAKLSEVMIGGERTVSKKIRVNGITPQKAMDAIEQKLNQRGLGANRQPLQKGEQLADDSQKFTGSFSQGEILRGETKILINVDITGQRKVAQKQRGSDDIDAGETLPDIQRQTTTQYGEVGVSINATGNDVQLVDEYITDLRDDIQVELESLAEEI